MFSFLLNFQVLLKMLTRSCIVNSHPGNTYFTELTSSDDPVLFWTKTSRVNVARFIKLSSEKKPVNSLCGQWRHKGFWRALQSPSASPLHCLWSSSSERPQGPWRTSSWMWASSMSWQHRRLCSNLGLLVSEAQSADQEMGWPLSDEHFLYCVWNTVHRCWVPQYMSSAKDR